MKSSLHSTIVAMCALFAAHQSHAQAMLLASENGSTKSYAINAIQSVVFHDNTLMVNDGICETHHFSVFFTDYVTLDGTIGKDELNVQRGLAIYPNPSSDFLQLNVKGKAVGDVVVYNALGTIVIQKSSCTFPYTLDVQALSSGMYTIHVQNQSIQFVKQ
jgi:hypothetical protein